MALKPKDVRVPLPVQLILDCHWLICVRGEGLTDRSIVVDTRGAIVQLILTVRFVSRFKSHGFSTVQYVLCLGKKYAVE